MTCLKKMYGAKRSRGAVSEAKCYPPMAISSRKIYISLFTLASCPKIIDTVHKNATKPNNKFI